MQTRAGNRILTELGHTCLNHFVLLDLRGHEGPNRKSLQRLARKFCEAPIADDMLVLRDSPQADARLEVIGADGREADFCGNGMIYVAAKLGKERGLDRVLIDSPAGITEAVREGRGWRIAIGAVTDLADDLGRVAVGLLDEQPVRALLRAGEPHLVMTTPEELGGFHVTRQEFEEYCRPFRDVTGIAGGINITVVFERGEDSVLIRTFERGVRRHTYSCGTGAVAAIAATFGVPDSPKTFRTCAPGGAHRVDWAAGKWYLAAMPQPIAEGYLVEDTLHLPLSGLAAYESAAESLGVPRASPASPAR